MPGPLRKRKRQPRERVSNRSTDDPTVASKAAETDKGESSHEDSAKAKGKNRGASGGEYRPL